MGTCPPTNLKNTLWYVWISQDKSEPLSNEGCSNTSDSSPLFYKIKHFLRTNLESLISLTAQRIWHVCFHPHVFYKVLIQMLRPKALYKVFGISHTRVFPGRRVQEAFLDPLERHWWSQRAPGGGHHSCSRQKRHPLLVKGVTMGGLCPNVIDVAVVLHGCSRAVVAVFVQQYLPVKQVYLCLLSEAFTEVFWWEFYEWWLLEPLWSANILLLGKHLLLSEGTHGQHASVWLMTRWDFCHEGLHGKSCISLHKKVNIFSWFTHNSGTETT